MAIGQMAMLLPKPHIYGFTTITEASYGYSTITKSFYDHVDALILTITSYDAEVNTIKAFLSMQV